MANNIDGPTEQTIAKKNRKEISVAKIWNAVVKNYEMIQGAQISNSFILLMVLNEATHSPKYYQNIFHLLYDIVSI
jgi:hypothetical protein